MVALALTLGVAAAKGVQLSPSSSGATKLVSTKTLESGEHEGSSENQEWDVRGSCMDQRLGTFYSRSKDKSMSTIIQWLTYREGMICLVCQVCIRSHRMGGGGREGRVTDGVENGKFRTSRGDLSRRGYHQVLLDAL